MLYYVNVGFDSLLVDEKACHENWSVCSLLK